jgi:hypothetical protein
MEVLSCTKHDVFIVLACRLDSDAKVRSTTSAPVGFFMPNDR